MGPCVQEFQCPSGSIFWENPPLLLESSVQFSLKTEGALSPRCSWSYEDFESWGPQLLSPPRTQHRRSNRALQSVFNPGNSHLSSIRYHLLCSGREEI